MKAHNNKTQPSLLNQATDLFDREIWKVEEIGFKPDSVNGIYQLNFSKLQPKWFNKIVKKFVHFQSATKSLSSCYSYLGRLTHFSDFMINYFPEI